MAKLNDFAKRLRDAPAKGVLEPPAAESSSNIPENQEEGDWLSGGGLKFSVDSARVRNKLKRSDLVFFVQIGRNHYCSVLFDKKIFTVIL